MKKIRIAALAAMLVLAMGITTAFAVGGRYYADAATASATTGVPAGACAMWTPTATVCATTAARGWAAGPGPATDVIAAAAGKRAGS